MYKALIFGFALVCFGLGGLASSQADEIEPDPNAVAIDDINVKVEAADQQAARNNLKTYLTGKGLTYNDKDVYPEVHLCTKIPGTPLKERCCRTPQGDNCTLRVLNQ